MIMKDENLETFIKKCDYSFIPFVRKHPIFIYSQFRYDFVVVDGYRVFFRRKNFMIYRDWFLYIDILQENIERFRDMWINSINQ